MFIVAITGSFIGKKIVLKVPQEKLRIFVLFFIGLVSLKFIYDGLAIFW